MLVVERPLEEIYDGLPPTLYQKKFGTWIKFSVLHLQECLRLFA